jgi:hypothetical protein
LFWFIWYVPLADRIPQLGVEVLSNWKFGCATALTAGGRCRSTELVPLDRAAGVDVVS